MILAELALLWFVAELIVSAPRYVPSATPPRSTTCELRPTDSIGNAVARWIPSDAFRTGARRSKYGAQKTQVDGHSFDSKKEARRYAELKLLERMGEIRDLRVHPRWPLLVNDREIGSATWDFSYIDEVGVFVIEDVKSPATRRETAYRLRRKVFEACHGLEVTEV